jgi:hypothetical protein
MTNYVNGIKITGLELLKDIQVAKSVEYKVSVLEYLNTLDASFAYTKTEILNDIEQGIKNHNDKLLLDCSKYHYTYSTSTNCELVIIVNK